MLVGMLPASAPAADYNALILKEIGSMPQGGRYAVTREAAVALRSSVQQEGSALRIAPGAARPSYCSGATYLVFLKTLEQLRRSGSIELPAEAQRALLIAGQPDGHGVWGRWNANGPGTARLFHELGLGRNFEGYEQARPGDFMKIFWTKEVGSHERGHSVVYLGREMRDGQEHVRFWSSNQPDGYGTKSVPRSKIAYALFSRLEHPETAAKASSLPRADAYLAGLLKVRSSPAEVRAKSGIR